MATVVDNLRVVCHSSCNGSVMGNVGSTSSSTSDSTLEHSELLGAASRLDENQAQQIVDTFWQELNQTSDKIQMATSNVNDASLHLKLATWKLVGYAEKFKQIPNQSSASIAEKLLKAKDTSQNHADAVQQLIALTQELKKDIKVLSAKLEELDRKQSSVQKGKNGKKKLLQKYRLK